MSTTATTGAAPSRLRHFARLGFLRDYGIVFSFAALFIVLSIASGPFFTRQNLENILDQWSATTIIAVGMTFVIIAGGFDLSVGSIFAVSGVIARRLELLDHADPAVPAGRVEDPAVAEPEGDVIGLSVAVRHEIAGLGSSTGLPAASCWSASRGTIRPSRRYAMWTSPEQSMPASVMPPQR